MKRTLCGAVILAALLWWQSTDAFVAAFRVIDGGAAAGALAIGVLTTVLSAARWRLVANGLGLRLPLATAVADYYRALFLNAVLPAGVLGDVHRAVHHGRSSGDVKRGVRAVVVERAAGQIVLGVVAAAALATAAGLVPAPVAWGVVGCGLVVTAALAFGKRWGSWPGALLLSAGALAGHVALFVLAAHLAGATAPILRLVPLALVALLVMALPVNVGGWGPREAASSLAFGAAGLGSTQGLTVAVVYGVLAFLAGLPGVVVLVVRGVARDRRGTAGKPGADAEDGLGAAAEEGEMVAERPRQAREQVPALAGGGE